MCQVANFVGLLIEDVVVVAEEGSFEQFLEFVLVSAEAFGEEAEEGLVDSFHHAAFQNHVDELVFIALSDVHLQNLVSALLEIDSRLDGEVDCLAKVHQVLLCQILDAFFGRGSIVLLLVSIWLLETSEVFFSQDLLLDCVPLRLGLFVFGVKAENIEGLFAL